MKFEYLEARIYSDHTWLTVTEKNGLTQLEKWDYNHLEILDKLGLDSWQMCTEYNRINGERVTERVITMMRELKDSK